MRAIVARPQRNRLPIVLDCLVELPERLQRVAEVVVDFGVTVMQLERAPVLDNGLARASGIPQDVAEIPVIDRIVQIPRDRVADQANRRIEIPVTEVYESQQMRRVGMRGIFGEQLPVDRSGFIDTI